MTSIKKSSNQKSLFVVALLFLASALYALLQQSPQTITQKPLVPTATPLPTQVNDGTMRGTMEGEVVCLPHKNTSGPQTMECAIGIQVNKITYYVLDTNLLSANPPQFTTGNRIRANGVLTPIERLNTDHWNTYDVKGIFSVTDSLVVLK